MKEEKNNSHNGHTKSAFADKSFLGIRFENEYIFMSLKLSVIVN